MFPATVTTDNIEARDARIVVNFTIPKPSPDGSSDQHVQQQHSINLYQAPSVFTTRSVLWMGRVSYLNTDASRIRMFISTDQSSIVTLGKIHRS